MSSSASYPRPDFQREALNWQSLNGSWTFAFDDNNSGLSELWHQKGIVPGQRRTIKVPYAFQTIASGIGKHEAHEVIWYERTITDIRTSDEIRKGHRLLVRFGAVDYESSVWLNGSFVGFHRGGHVPFDMDLTDALSSGDAGGSQRLTVRVRDSPFDLTQPRGKQYWKPVPEGIYYTPTSGIWQSVWLESVPTMRLGTSSEGTILRSDDIKRGLLHAQVVVTGRRPGEKCAVEIEARLDGILVSKSAQRFLSDRDSVLVDVAMKVPHAEQLQICAPFKQDSAWLNGVALWHPDHPILYELVLRLYDSAGVVVDEVRTTTGMRRIDWLQGDGTFRLNGKPFFQALVLDQGYWPDTGMTPPSTDALKKDIEISMKMGFNGCRKHQKVEDPLFLYWADRMGYLVWGEIANALEFDQIYTERFNEEWMDCVKRDINHPCIVTWTPNNESWGYTALQQGVSWPPGNIGTPFKSASLATIEQRNHIRSLYYMTKTMDPSRPINDNCGWEHVMTDLTTYHDYADSSELRAACSKMEGGILGNKGNHPMFVSPICDGSVVFDSGSAHQPGAPVLCTEFGGVNIAPSKNDEAGDRDWGYTTAANAKDLLKRLRSLVMAVVEGRNTCGFVYTQLYDVEQEVNGLYSFTRQEKISASEVKEIIDASAKYYYDHVV